MELVMLAGYVILARRGKFGYGQHALNFSVYFGMTFAGKILEAIDHRLIYLLAICFFGTIARLYWLFFERTRDNSVRNQDDKCSLGVFMGSGPSSPLGDVGAWKAECDTRWTHGRDESSLVHTRF